MLHHLLHEILIGSGNLAPSVVGEDAPSLNAGFCGADGEGDLRVKYPEHISRLT